eukprot:6651122-Pyramimonas_sp.AAC.1
MQARMQGRREIQRPPANDLAGYPRTLQPKMITRCAPPTMLPRTSQKPSGTHEQNELLAVPSIP